MDVVVILERLQALGLELRAAGGNILARPRGMLTDDARSLIRAHKAELLAELQKAAEANTRKERVLAYLEAHPAVKRACFYHTKSDPAYVIQTVAIREHKAELLAALDPAAENRRERALARLAAEPAVRLVVICDGEGDPVPVTIAIRSKGTCEVLIPAAKFDPFLLLDLVKRHGDTLHEKPECPIGLTSSGGDEHEPWKA